MTTCCCVPANRCHTARLVHRVTCCCILTGDNLGCFGGSRNKKKEAGGVDSITAAAAGGGVNTTRTVTGALRADPPRGMELLWQPDLVSVPQALHSNMAS